MKILMTGATGFVGSKLLNILTANGHTVHVLTRSISKSAEHTSHPDVKFFSWNDFKHPPPAESIEGVSGIIHLMGENIAAKRWSDHQKEVLRSSRVDSTHSLAQLIKTLPRPLDFFVSASAVGIYPVNQKKVFDENSPHGKGFLATLCHDWEQAVQELTNVRRKVIVRTGVVLDKDGGALQKMLPPFKLGLGGPIGDGDQMMSWIHRDDLVEIYYQSAVDESMEGVYNAVAPKAVNNFDFTKALGNALHRPTLFPVPALPLKIAFGEMSGVILDSQEVIPARLNEKGFAFRFPDIRSCLNHIFNRNHN